MRRLKRMIALGAILALTIALPGTALAENGAVYTLRDGAKVYDINRNEIGSLPAGTTLELVSTKGKVCQVSIGDKTGYMLKSDLTTTAPTVSASGDDYSDKTLNVYVAHDGAPVYDRAGRIVGMLPANTQLNCTGVQDDLCRVTTGDRVAFMYKSDLSTRPVKVAGKAPAAAEKGVRAYVCQEEAEVFNAKGKVIGSLSLNEQVTVTAAQGDICQVTANGRTAYIKKADLSRSPTPTPEPEPEVVEEPTPARTASLSAAEAEAGSTVTPASGAAQEMDWWNSSIQTIFARYVTATITDVETGLSWREQRRGGTNHADVQPLTAADTAVLKKVYGGKWSWARRAIYVTIDGVNYAASMNGMPHGGSSISGNNFDGHHCIHFTNSRTHGSNSLDPQHQAAIARALAAYL